MRSKTMNSQSFLDLELTFPAIPFGQLVSEPKVDKCWILLNFQH
ncbi:hypothetical protein HanRHA438_Chr09g0380421 [Helianthus annuus]|nr:hypothetical protein HanIR_Chr09g0397881 [Helianthus annuus]KAJ0540993.1 hypothetical protein HanHA89_Chr09g0323351 [Helianthus annuus]KAJ0886526.1 hypothetical protein HanRHA438_Chr09g0380421 [Helianthus annuus]